MSCDMGLWLVICLLAFVFVVGIAAALVVIGASVSSRDDEPEIVEKCPRCKSDMRYVGMIDDFVYFKCYSCGKFIRKKYKVHGK